MKLIALTGPKKVGKSTVANAIADLADEETHILSFADPMRSMLLALGVDLSRLHDQSLKEKKIDGIGKSARQLMQSLGTGWGRDMVDENIWLWSMQKRIERSKADGAALVIIDDCRFDNEALWVTQQQGSVIRLARDGFEYGDDNHESEQPIRFQHLNALIDASDEDAAARVILKIIKC
jgi:energy-coupling factor transporter ATP-binding protein EcfA2